MINSTGGKIDVNGNFSSTFSGVIGNGSGTPAGGLIVTDTSGFGGSVGLSGVNTYSGGTTINNFVTLQVTQPSVL